MANGAGASELALLLGWGLLSMNRNAKGVQPLSDGSRIQDRGAELRFASWPMTANDTSGLQHYDRFQLSSLRVSAYRLSDVELVPLRNNEGWSSAHA